MAEEDALLFLSTFFTLPFILTKDPLHLQNVWLSNNLIVSRELIGFN